jgi:hypothetical protein
LHDRPNSRVYFYYPVSDSVFPDKCVVYNYRRDRWGVDDRTIEAVTDYQTPGVSYNDLTGMTYEQLSSLTYDLAWQNDSQIQPAIIDISHRVKTLSGAAETTSFTTGDLGDDSRFFCVNRIRPRFLTRPTSATWTHYYRNNPGETLTADTAVSLSSSGSFDLLREARWHRGKLELTGDWELAVINAEGEGGGFE